MKFIVYFLLFIMITGVGTVQAQTKKQPRPKKNIAAPAVVRPQQKKDSIASGTKPVITFYELGSVKCIPCKQMQPVMKSIGEKYGDQIKVIFYDVWKEEQAHFAQDFGIRVIPTQVFIDEKGKEIKRHEGFFPEKDIDAFLQSKGLKLKPSSKG